MKTVIENPKSLTDVWEWKERVYQKYAFIKEVEKYALIEKSTAPLILKLGLKKISEIPIGN
ncbi:MAG: hypothetical protein A2096_11225 [Spirochaetes bacterium GWF1_41_5]|nr:MAG: hypothetical protein A2096_11225 [Spirochaetes bacterium GWF1_41_5]HBE04132.1 hypothetical protein [Spirochaetia bacterium]